jgi:hypothetical protein
MGWMAPLRHVSAKLLDRISSDGEQSMGEVSFESPPHPSAPVPTGYAARFLRLLECNQDRLLKNFV